MNDRFLSEKHVVIDDRDGLLEIMTKTGFLFQVQGRSMFPYLRNGDVVLAKKVPFAEIAIGDVVVFHKFNNRICHRVIGINRTQDNLSFRVKGDFSFKRAERVTPEEILGKAIAVSRQGREFLISRHNLVQYYLSRVLSLVKDAIIKSFECAYRFSIVRKMLKLILPLKVAYTSIINVRDDDSDDCAFFNLLPFPAKRFSIAYRLITEYKHKPIAKLYVLNHKPNGRFYLYGPYVKLLFRARYTGVNMVNRALKEIEKNHELKFIRAIIPRKQKGLFLLYSGLGFYIENSLKKYFIMRGNNAGK